MFNHSQKGFGDDDLFGDFTLDAQEEIYANSEKEAQLEAVKKDYEKMLLKYKEKHPDVAKLKKTMEKLETEIEEEKKAFEEAALAENEASEPDNEEAVLAEAELSVEDQIEDSASMPDFAAMQQETQLKQIQNEIQKIQ